jgi:hypothetical protein
MDGMATLAWLSAHAGEIVPALAVVVVGIITAVLTWAVQRHRIRPELITHNCRISGIDVYTYFDSKNKPIDPLCVYLSREGKHKCMFDPDMLTERSAQKVLLASENDSRNLDAAKSASAKRLDLNAKQCYMTGWGRNVGR